MILNYSSLFIVFKFSFRPFFYYYYFFHALSLSQKRNICTNPPAPRSQKHRIPPGHASSNRDFFTALDPTLTFIFLFFFSLHFIFLFRLSSSPLELRSSSRVLELVSRFSSRAPTLCVYPSRFEINEWILEGCAIKERA